MSKSKPRKKKGAKREPRFDPESVRRLAVIVGLCSGVLAVGLGATVGIDALDRTAARRIAEHTTVEIAWPHNASPDPAYADDTWLPEPDRRELTAIAEAAALEAGPLDVAPLKAISDALSASTWFVEPPEVRRVDGGVIRVEGRWRKYQAVIRVDGWDYLIGGDGVPLPRQWPAGETNQWFIDGVPTRPSSYTDGSPWPGEEVPAALELLTTIAEAGLADQIAGVDTARFFLGRELAIITDTGGRIVWGAPPSERVAGEVTLDEKLHRLRALRRETGRIDGGHALVEIQGPFVLTGVQPG